jgi:tetratricopeptide (TPR) repeat protein
MRFVTLLLVGTMSIGGVRELWESIQWRTNSLSANRRGVKAYGAKKYGEAAAAFNESDGLRPSAASAFDLGTAQIAAGRREDGSASLTRALADPKLRPDALYNRGTSALLAKAYDNAIRDYSDALRQRPGDAAAKRNLEIALAQKEAARRAQQQQQQGHQPSSGPKPDHEQPAPGDNDQQRRDSEADVDRLLRSVQQQEQEELSRMRRSLKGEPRKVGW